MRREREIRPDNGWVGERPMNKTSAAGFERSNSIDSRVAIIDSGGRGRSEQKQPDSNQARYGRTDGFRRDPRDSRSGEPAMRRTGYPDYGRGFDRDRPPRRRHDYDDGFRRTARLARIEESGSDLRDSIDSEVERREKRQRMKEKLRYDEYRMHKALADYERWKRKREEDTRRRRREEDERMRREEERLEWEDREKGKEKRRRKRAVEEEEEEEEESVAPRQRKKEKKKTKKKEESEEEEDDGEEEEEEDNGKETSDEKHQQKKRQESEKAKQKPQERQRRRSLADSQEPLEKDGENRRRRVKRKGSNQGVEPAPSTENDGNNGEEQGQDEQQGYEDGQYQPAGGYDGGYAGGQAGPRFKDPEDMMPKTSLFCQVAGQTHVNEAAGIGTICQLFVAAGMLVLNLFLAIVTLLRSDWTWFLVSLFTTVKDLIFIPVLVGSYRASFGLGGAGGLAAIFSMLRAVYAFLLMGNGVYVAILFFQYLSFMSSQPDQTIAFNQDRDLLYRNGLGLVWDTVPGDAIYSVSKFMWFLFFFGGFAFCAVPCILCGACCMLNAAETNKAASAYAIFRASATSAPQWNQNDQTEGEPLDQENEEENEEVEGSEVENKDAILPSEPPQGDNELTRIGNAAAKKVSFSETGPIGPVGPPSGNAMRNPSATMGGGFMGGSSGGGNPFRDQMRNPSATMGRGFMNSQADVETASVQRHGGAAMMNRTAAG